MRETRQSKNWQRSWTTSKRKSYLYPTNWITEKRRLQPWVKNTKDCCKRWNFTWEQSRNSSTKETSLSDNRRRTSAKWLTSSKIRKINILTSWKTTSNKQECSKTKLTRVHSTGKKKGKSYLSQIETWRPSWTRPNNNWLRQPRRSNDWPPHWDTNNRQKKYGTL